MRTVSMIPIFPIMKTKLEVNTQARTTVKKAMIQKTTMKKATLMKTIMMKASIKSMKRTTMKMTTMKRTTMKRNRMTYTQADLIMFHFKSIIVSINIQRNIYPMSHLFVAKTRQ